MTWLSEPAPIMQWSLDRVWSGREEKEDALCVSREVQLSTRTADGACVSLEAEKGTRRQG